MLCSWCIKTNHEKIVKYNYCIFHSSLIYCIQLVIYSIQKLFLQIMYCFYGICTAFFGWFSANGKGLTINNLNIFGKILVSKCCLYGNHYAIYYFGFIWPRSYGVLFCHYLIFTDYVRICSRLAFNMTQQLCRKSDKVV